MGNRHRVVIVGGGFAGLWAAKALRRAPLDVTLVDRHNYHTFFPLLYQVAAAELDPADICYPIRTILRRHANARFVLADVESVDRATRRVITTAGDIPYDSLVLAVGSTTAHFDVPGAREYTFGLRTLRDAIDLRNHVLETLERAAGGEDASGGLLDYVIVGGGPTGVEFAGALQELLRGPLRRDHTDLDLGRARVTLVEAAPRLLSIYPDRLSAYAARRLRRIGVDVRLDTQVASVDAEGIAFTDGARLATRTVVWAAGVGGPPDLARWGLTTGRGGRVVVTPALHLEDDPAVWVVGDASLPDGAAPMVAQNASQQGTLAAGNILRSIAGNALLPYRYRDLGNMAVIGRNAAVVHLFGRLAFAGYPAWIMWLFLHLLKLVGFRNRLAALISWTGDYLFRDRVARLILPGRR